MIIGGGPYCLYHCGWWSAMMLIMEALALSGFNMDHATASPRTQIARSLLKPHAIDAQVPGQFALHLRPADPLTIEGYVYDEKGNHLEGADVAVIVYFPLPISPRNHWPQPLGTTTSNGNGAFHMSVPSLPLYQMSRLYMVVRCEGYGVGKTELDVTKLRHDVDIHLQKERLLHGQVVGPDGKPAVGVQLRTCLFYELPPDEIIPKTFFACAPELSPPSWPPPTTTDVQGRFILRGMAPSEDHHLIVQFSIDDPRYAPLDPDLSIPSEGEREQAFVFRPNDTEEPVVHLEEARFIEGMIICEDTKKPLSGAWLSIVFCNKSMAADNQFAGIWVQTDEQGRFHVRGRPRAGCSIYVYPPVGLAYPAWGQHVKWPKHAVRHKVRIEVPKGLLVCGKVVEEGTGKPVAGAGVEYQLCRDREDSYHSKAFAYSIYWAAEYRKILTDNDGAFQVAVVPGQGYLMVKAPGPEFVSRYVTWGDLQYDRPAAFWYVLEGLTQIDPKPGTKLADLTIPVRRGVTIKGHVLDPHGDLVNKAMLLTPAYPRIRFRHFVPTTAWPRPIVNGRFELRGCDPNTPRRVYFLDVEHQYGAAVELDVTNVQEERATIHLQSCGSASPLCQNA